MTLVEVIVVIVVLLTLVAIVWLVIGPRAKEAAYGASVRHDLSQLQISLQLYMSDYDDEFPHRFSALRTHVREAPHKSTGMAQPLTGCASRTTYRFMRHADYLLGESMYSAKFPFDPAVNAVFKAPFFCRKPGSQESFNFMTTGGQVQELSRPVHEVLGVRLDGAIGWFDSHEQWQEEWASKVGLNLYSGRK
jgi:hypothetical protein